MQPAKIRFRPTKRVCLLAALAILASTRATLGQTSKNYLTVPAKNAYAHSHDPFGMAISPDGSRKWTKTTCSENS